MTVELKIRFDGSAAGLANHRLSLSEFHEALGNLLSAVRRTATSIETDATDPAAGAKGGRYSKMAERIDVQLSVIEEGCVNLGCVITYEPQVGETGEMFPELERRTLARLVEHIDNERRGIPASAAVRKYLRSIPAGVDSQRYALYENGVEIRCAEFGQAEFVDDSQLVAEGPRLFRSSGFVISVSFDQDGRGIGVALRGEDGVLRAIDASPELVDKGIELRGRQVIAQIVEQKSKKRLINLWPAEDQPSKVDIKDRTSRIFADWHETLSELAK